MGQICLRLFGVTVDAVFTSELYGDGFALELEQAFRSAGFAEARVGHVLVDLGRKAVPISASAIRADRELAPVYLSPVVHAAFVRRVCVLGGESSGKTSLSRALAESLQTPSVEEYGRELWAERQGQLALDDFLLIARTQIAHEERAARAARQVTISDTSPLTTLFYCLDQFGMAPPELSELARRHYDLTLLCAPDFAFVQDGTRRDAAFRGRQHEFYARELERRAAPWLLLEGPLEVRIERACRAIAAI